jgi:hypothetical protein
MVFFALDSCLLSSFPLRFLEVGTSATCNVTELCHAEMDEKIVLNYAHYIIY